MTADAAHVAAVAEALCNAGCDSPTRGCDTEAETLSRHGHLATVAVETLTPLIRAQVAAEIEAECMVTHDPDVCGDCEAAARIAEGTP